MECRFMKMLLALAVLLASIAASDYALAAGGSDYNTESQRQYDSHIWHGR
jgi:hypothetical protein